MAFIIALCLINVVGACLYKVEWKRKQVNWPNVYRLEHEIWPEIKHTRNHSYDKKMDCWTCFMGPPDPKRAVNPPVKYHRPPPPSFIPVRTSNEPLVATFSVNAPLVQTIAFENQRVRYLGEIDTLLHLLEWYDPKVGYCFWVRDVQRYFVWTPRDGWKRFGEIVDEAINATYQLL